MLGWNTPAPLNTRKTGRKTLLRPYSIRENKLNLLSISHLARRAPAYAHRIITPYAEKLVAKHGTFKGNAILANQIARAVYFMLQSGQAFDAERMVAHRS